MSLGVSWVNIGVRRLTHTHILHQRPEEEKQNCHGWLILISSYRARPPPSSSLSLAPFSPLLSSPYIFSLTLFFLLLLLLNHSRSHSVPPRSRAIIFLDFFFYFHCSMWRTILAFKFSSVEVEPPEVTKWLLLSIYKGRQMLWPKRSFSCHCSESKWAMVKVDDQQRQTAKTFSTQHH